MDMVYNRLASVAWMVAMLFSMVMLAGVLAGVSVLSSISRVVVLIMTSALVLMSLGLGYLSMIGFPDTVWTHGITADNLWSGISIVGLLYVVWSVLAFGFSKLFDEALVVESLDYVLDEMRKAMSDGFTGRV